MRPVRYLERVPRPELLPYLECLWEIADATPRTSRPVERIVPDGCPELIVHLEDCFARSVNGRWRVQPRVFLAGTLSRPWQLRGGRRVRTIGIRLRPGAATALFPVVMARARDREVPLAKLVGRAAAHALRVGLSQACSSASRFAAAEAWLIDRLERASARRQGARPAVDLILKARGQVPIDQVARSLGWTRRRLERAFERDLGIAPKLYARIVRLNAVLASLDDRARRAAVELALEAGYFDQAHLLRDFRLLAGRRPLSPREADGDMARNFTRPGRLRTLLRGE